MAEDPRKYTMFGIKHCIPKELQSQAKASARKDFFNALGKVGDIEVANRIGLGGVTKGLRILAKTSNSIRVGDVDSAIIPNDSGYVLDTVGIPPSQAVIAGRFNPQALNRAVGQADSILKDVKNGSFTVDKIPGVVTDIQNLAELVDGIYTDGSGVTKAKAIKLCGATPYAIDLIKYAPKYKFLFIVEFIMHENYKVMDEDSNILAFVVKTSTRPQITVEHDDVNMYNFHTKVPKKVTHEPITLRFYDDTKGFAHKFCTSYLNYISPITRNGGMDTGGALSMGMLQANSMEFNRADIRGTASLSALEGDAISMIDEMRVYHLYDYGRLINVYHYKYPKILSMNFDELSMLETGEGNEIELQFGYDALHITPALSVADSVDKVSDLTGRGLYPIKPNMSLNDEIEQAADDNSGEPKIPVIGNVLAKATGVFTDTIQTASNYIDEQLDSLSDAAIDAISSSVKSAAPSVSSVFKQGQSAIESVTDFSGSFFKS